VVSEAEVTLFLPSDFAGTISLAHPDGRSAPSVRLSTAFSRDVLPHVIFSALHPAASLEDDDYEHSAQDGVRATAPVVNLQVWDVMTATPERKSGSAKGMIKRLLRPAGHAHRPSLGKPIDWDFLLD
jgi:hypothetical protein